MNDVGVSEAEENMAHRRISTHLAMQEDALLMEELNHL